MKPKARKNARPAATRPLLHLPEAGWPAADRAAFAKAFDRVCDVFDEDGSGSRLKPRTKAALCFAYRRWLGWVTQYRPCLIDVPPERRATPETFKAFALHLRTSCSPRTVATQVGKLNDALRHMYPATDRGWLRQLKTRLERATPQGGRRPIKITSQRLLDAGLGRLDAVDLLFAATAPNTSYSYLQSLALAYRDGMLVALAAFIPMRRANIAQLEIGSTILRTPTGWSVHIPPEFVKNGVPIEADLEERLSERVERYVSIYRPLIYRSHSHTGFWASARGQMATDAALYKVFKKEVKVRLGLDLTLHDVRRIGVTTWAVHDPVNAAGAKDLLGDRSDRVITRHYNLANGVEVTRTMAQLKEKLKAL